MSHTYTEHRQHELRRSRIVMVDGLLSTHTSTVESGASVRVWDGRGWGFASAHEDSPALLDQAHRNARAIARLANEPAFEMAGGAARAVQPERGRAAMTPQQKIDALAALDAHLRGRYPAIRSLRLVALEESHRKQLRNSHGSDSLAHIRRGVLYMMLTGEGDDGKPVELFDRLSCIGSLADLDLSVEALAPRLAQLDEHLRAKCQAVPVRGGLHQVVMAPEMTGILAHEAMGHPCEADIVLGGAITADLLGQPVASELVSMVDFAHTWNGEEVMMPVYHDDEGSPARDAVLIDRGRLAGYMHSRETAARMGVAPTGSARAYAPDDEPLVRMRNTAVLPGTQTRAQLIEGVEDGYLLLGTSNGQADTTTEFMFGINLAYEIRGGKVGRAVRDTTVSGSAIEVLKTVDGVADDMEWSSLGYCGKKQPMVVSMGGPSLRARLHVGGA